MGWIAGLDREHLIGSGEIVCITSSAVVFSPLRVYLHRVSALTPQVDASIDAWKEYVGFNSIIYTKCQHQCQIQMGSGRVQKCQRWVWTRLKQFNVTIIDLPNLRFKWLIFAWGYLHPPTLGSDAWLIEITLKRNVLCGYIDSSSAVISVFFLEVFFEQWWKFALTGQMLSLWHLLVTMSREPERHFSGSWVINKPSCGNKVVFLFQVAFLTHETWVPC